MLYTTFWPLPAFRAQSNRGEFQTKASFRSLHQILHISSLFINFHHLSHRRPSVQAIGVIFEPKPISTPINKNPTQFIAFHHFWMTSSLNPTPVPPPGHPTPRRQCLPPLLYRSAKLRL